jgi:hypothetical protein
MMFFRRRERAEQTPSDGWRALALRLELADASDVAERIRRWLDLGDTEVAPVYLLQRAGLPAVYLYDAHTVRQGPAGTARRTRRACLVRSDGPISSAAFRAWPRQNEVLESLEASRSGAVRVTVASDPDFDGAVSVFARDAGVALASLVPAVRQVLARLLVGRGVPGARVVVGERHLVASFEAVPGDALAALESVLADTLALVALLPAAGGAPARHDALASAPDDPLDPP